MGDLWFLKSKFISKIKIKLKDAFISKIMQFAAFDSFS